MLKLNREKAIVSIRRQGDWVATVATPLNKLRYLSEPNTTVSGSPLQNQTLDVCDLGYMSYQLLRIINATPR